MRIGDNIPSDSTGFGRLERTLEVNHENSPDGTRVGMIGPFGAEVCNLPRPLPDPLPELERWRVWVECITRMARDADGVVLPLPNDLWLGRKQRLDGLGGSPVPQPIRSDEKVAGSDE